MQAILREEWRRGASERVGVGVGARAHLVRPYGVVRYGTYGRIAYILYLIVC